MRLIFIGLNDSELPYTRVRCYNFANALKKLGLDTEVLSYQEHLSPRWGGIKMLRLCDKAKLLLNLKAWIRLFNKKGSIFYIQKLHYHSAAPFLLSRAGRNKFILDYDDWDLDRPLFFKRGYLNRLFFGFEGAEEITRGVASKAVCCIASSRFLYNFLLQYNKNVCYVPTGVDTGRFTPPRHDSNNKITFVWTGQIWGEVIYRNILYLLDCFSEVRRQYSNVKFRIIGGGELMPRLKEHIKEYFSRFDIEIIDWVGHQDMPTYLSDVDIGLLPLIPDADNKTWMESKSPTKLFEYMAMGLPTVATRMGEAKYILANSEDGFLAGDKKEFIEKMRLLAGDKELRLKMGKRARERAEKEYSLEVLAKRLADFIASTAE